MTRKRFGKLMMGKGVSRNVVREIAKTMREMKEAEGLWRHYNRIGGSIVRRRSCVNTTH